MNMKNVRITKSAVTDKFIIEFIWKDKIMKTAIEEDLNDITFAIKCWFDGI
jgi:hypothetical protein